MAMFPPSTLSFWSVQGKTSRAMVISVVSGHNIIIHEAFYCQVSSDNIIITVRKGLNIPGHGHIRGVRA